jgi:hypothetical protein
MVVGDIRKFVTYKVLEIKGHYLTRKRASFAGFQDLAFGKISLARIAGMGDPKRENNTRLSTSGAGMSA